MEMKVDDRVTAAKESAVQGMDYFLRNFSFVPDDKLTWTPTPTAKSAIRIAAHTALYAGRFAKMIREQQIPQVDNLTEWLVQRDAEEVAITCRREMEAIFRKGTEEVLAALDGLPQEALGTTLDSGVGFSMSMTHVISLPGWHATLHSGQIDYLQTCWDDQQVYF